MKHVYVLSAESESGDNYGPYVFSHPVPDEALEVFWRMAAPGEFPDDIAEDWGGKWGSALHIRNHRCPIQSLRPE